MEFEVEVMSFTMLKKPAALRTMQIRETQDSRSDAFVLASLSSSLLSAVLLALLGSKMHPAAAKP